MLPVPEVVPSKDELNINSPTRILYRAHNALIQEFPLFLVVIASFFVTPCNIGQSKY